MDQIPYSREAERQLLSCLLMSEAALPVSGDLQADDFFAPAHRAVFEAIAELRDSRKLVDLVTVGDALDRSGRGSLLHDESLATIAQAAPIWHNAKHYAGIVQRDGMLRRLMQQCAELIQRAQDGGDVSELLADARRVTADLEARGAGSGPARLGDKLRDVVEALEAKAERKAEHMVTTEIPTLDKYIGGFRAGQLIVVAGRPGMGKSAFAGSVGLRAANRGLPVLMFTLEMSFQEMAERFIGAAIKFSVHRLSQGAITKPEYSHIYAQSSALERLPLWIDDRVLTMPQIAGTARSWRVRQTAPIGLVVIDYIGLIRSTGRAETRQLEVGRMARAAKDLAKDIGMPVMLVSQLNRASEKEQREPTMSDLRESGEIEQHADMIIFPHREPPLYESGPANVIIAKHRGGKFGRAKCWWHAEEMLFTGSPVAESAREEAQ